MNWYAGQFYKYKMFLLKQVSTILIQKHTIYIYMCVCVCVCVRVFLAKEICDEEKM